MREIKFRAWDGKKYKEMYSWSYIRNESLQEIMDAGIVLMQYTGLRDKNGVEIYEGDIVHVKSFDPGGPGGTGRVVFDGGEYALVDKKETFIWLSNNADSSLGYVSKGEREVIGNIYQNPELIKI